MIAQSAVIGDTDKPTSTPGIAAIGGPTLGTNDNKPAINPRASGIGTPAAHSPSVVPTPTTVIEMKRPTNQLRSARPTSPTTSRIRARRSIGNSLTIDST